MVCEDYRPPAGYVPNMTNPLLDHQYSDLDQLTGPNRVLVPFLACGDLSGYDADLTYPLQVSTARHVQARYLQVEGGGGKKVP